MMVVVPMTAIWGGCCSAALGVLVAGISDQDGLLLHGVSSLRAGGARIDGVFVVEAAADGVPLDDLYAHRFCLLRGGGWRGFEDVMQQQA